MLPHVCILYPCFISSRLPIFFVCWPAFRWHFYSVRTVNFIRMSRFCRSKYVLRPHGLPTLNPSHICVRTIELKPFRRTVVVTPCHIVPLAGWPLRGRIFASSACKNYSMEITYVNFAMMTTHASECGTTGKMHASCPIMTYTMVIKPLAYTSKVFNLSFESHI